MKSFWNRNTSKNQQGFSLVEIMVAAGLLGVISLGVMRMTTDMRKNQKKTWQDYQSTSASQQIRDLLRDKTACENTFANSGKDMPDSGSLEVDVLYDSDGDEKFTADEDTGTVFGQSTAGQIRLEKVFVNEWEHDSDRDFVGEDNKDKEVGNVTLNILLKKIGPDDETTKKTTYGGLQTRQSFNMIFVRDKSSKEIESCYTSEFFYVKATCEALGGTLAEPPECKNLHVKQVVDKSAPDPDLTEYEPGITVEGDFHTENAAAFGIFPSDPVNVPRISDPAQGRGMVAIENMLGIGNNTPTGALEITAPLDPTSNVPDRLGLRMGVDSPNTGMEITSDSSGSSFIKFTEPNQTSDPYYNGQIRYSNTQNSMGFHTNNDDDAKMHISESGDVGIGQGLGEINTKLDVRGDIRAEDGNDAFVEMRHDSTNGEINWDGGDAFLNFKYDSNERMRLDHEGRLRVRRSLRVGGDASDNAPVDRGQAHFEDHLYIGDNFGSNADSGDHRLHVNGIASSDATVGDINGFNNSALVTKKWVSLRIAKTFSVDSDTIDDIGDDIIDSAMDRDGSNVIRDDVGNRLESGATCSTDQAIRSIHYNETADSFSVTCEDDTDTRCDSTTANCNQVCSDDGCFTNITTNRHQMWYSCTNASTHPGHSFSCPVGYFLVSFETWGSNSGRCCRIKKMAQ